MDGMIDGLTDDYIGSADKISVILCTREMRHGVRERPREYLRVGFIINITNSFPWRERERSCNGESVNGMRNSSRRRRTRKAHQRMFMFE